MRDRIEAEIEAVRFGRPKTPAKNPVDAEWLLNEVNDFVALARSGAYLGGDRRVSPRERTRWRLTFRQLASEARDALRQVEDDADMETAEAAMESLIDLACEVHDYNYFWSEDPVEAARFVVSDEVALLWDTLRIRCEFGEFAQRVGLQLARWERRYGWTRTGWGKVSQQETSFAKVLGRFLSVPDMWVGMADRYLDALDEVARNDVALPRGSRRSPEFVRAERARVLAAWHSSLLEKLAGGEGEDRLDRLSAHAALGGGELHFLQARLAHRRGDLERARELVHLSLEKLPGAHEFLEFAEEIGAPLPPAAARIVAERARPFSPDS